MFLHFVVLDEKQCHIVFDSRAISSSAGVTPCIVFKEYRRQSFLHTGRLISIAKELNEGEDIEKML